MADVAPALTGLQGFGNRRTTRILWETLTSANAAGTSVELAGARDLTIQIIGTFDSATVVLQGSNDNSNWATLTDPQGNNISKTAAAIETVTELPRYIRPSTSGGGASQDVDVLVLAKF